MSNTLDVLIVGAGFSGLGMAVTLQREGKRSWLLLEKGAGVGGTWRENHYPGCACDVPSHLYSFSFAPNPAWSHHFAPQPEILKYLEDVAQKEGVLAKCRFGVEVSACDFDERSATWTVTTKSGERHRARHVVLGVGALHNAKFPDVPGRERFKGAQVHSAQWDGALDLSGKRVALVGTGASAIQVLPAIAPVAKQVTVVQRTPAWVLPRGDRPISNVMKKLYAAVPLLRLLRRASIYAFFEARIVAFTGFTWLLRAAAWLGRRHMSVINNEATREKLTPNYQPGCKRILLSDDYYPAFNRENVSLEVGGVREVTEKGVVTADGREHECDVIAWCTGFDLAAPLAAMKVTGRSGKELARDAWKHGLHAYRGTTVPGFPNFYMLMGPNTGLGHNSMVYVIESQIRFVMKHLEALDAANARAIEVKEEATQQFNELIQSRFPGTVWSSGCASWYLDASGKNRTLWPGSTIAFRMITSELNLADVTFESAPVATPAVPEAA